MDNDSDSTSVDSGYKRPADDSDSSQTQSQSPRKKKKFSLTPDIIKSFKNAVFQILYISSNVSSHSNVDVEKLNRLNDTLKNAIGTLNVSQQGVQKRLDDLKRLMDELPTEETSPYKKSSISLTKETDIDTVIDDFDFAYTSIVILAGDVIGSVDTRSTLKLLAIQRTYESYIKHLERSKTLIEERQKAVESNQTQQNN